MSKKLLIILMLTCVAPAAFAQGCSMCTKTASQLDDKSAKGLNGGILYLAALPLGIMGTIGFVWWKSYRGKA
ncbi:MAG: hypothetical protein KDC07_10550 [Chitinophagaceae bacterium]|nr:hypothetical protein [Chitinophagaceae bacterium]MCB9046282.1 hypothetical protein [Chitinophagales bacterium]